MRLPEPRERELGVELRVEEEDEGVGTLLGLSRSSRIG